MSSAFELDDLSNKHRASSSSPIDAFVDPGPINPEDSREGTTATWAWAASGILISWSCALLFFPRILLFAIGQSQVMTPLESFLSLHFGLLLAFSALGLVLNIASPSPAAVAAAALDKKGPPPVHPFLVPIASFSLLSAFISYNTSGAGSLSLIYSSCTGMVGIWGLWVIVFSGPTVVSRKTGADKHTSSFIFGNKSSASEQKKRWKREQRKG